MSFLRNAMKSSISIRTIKPVHSLPFLLRQSPKYFSTETEAPPPPANDVSIDPFLQTPNNVKVYGKLNGISRHTLKSDIINLLEGCNLTMDDLKVNYARSNFSPLAMMVQFPSFKAYDDAFVQISKKGRLYRLDRIEQKEWDMTMPYNGKTVLLQNVPRNALTEDVERFLSGCEYESSSISFVLRQALPHSIKWATVCFPSKIQAMNAVLRKNRGFCLNNQISMRVLQ